MGTLLKRVFNTFFALLFAVFSINLSGVMAVQNAYATGGNSGTLKVQEKGQSSTTANNPHVCDFRFVGDNLFHNKTGDITVEGQSPTAGGTYLTVSLSTNGSGDGNTDYINDGGTLTLPNGHYKATLDNKFGTDPGNKSKSKVFWVDCDTPVTPTIPTLGEECGLDNDTFTTPSIDGVKYQVWFIFFWLDLSPGEHDTLGANSVTVRAVAEDGYVLNGDSQWTLNFTDGACTVEVEATAPTNVDECGTSTDSYTIPSTTGVIYKINGQEVQAGTYPGSGDVTVNAEAAQGYTLTGQTSWTFNFNDEQCVVQAVEPTFVDVCGSDSDTYTITAADHVTYKVNGVETSAGTYNGLADIVITAEASNGDYLLTGDSQWGWWFDDTKCATPEEPTFTDVCGLGGDNFTIPATEGVKYKVSIDGGSYSTYTAGTYDYNGVTGTVKIKASALNGYVLVNSASPWSHEYTANTCPVSTEEPTAVDVCGSTDDRYTIPSVDHVTYYVKVGLAWIPVSAGSHWGFGSVKIKAVADPGFSIVNQSEWTLYLNPSKCDAPAEDVTHVDVCGTDGDSYTIPTSEHVTYKKAVLKWWGIIPYIDYETVAAGTYHDAGWITIKAFADDGYKIDGQSIWLFNLDSSDCDTTGEVTGIDPANDICSIENDMFEISDVTGVGYQISVNGGNPQDIQPGVHYAADWAGLYYGSTADIKVTAYALPNYNYTGQSEWEYTFTDEDCTTATGLCEPSQQGVMVTITNHKPVASKAWIATDNGQTWTEYYLDAYETIEVLVPTTNFLADVEVVASDESTVLKEAYDCTPGRGNVVPPVATPTNVSLPLTGPNPAIQLLTVVIAGLMAYGATLFVTKRWNLGQDK